MKKKDRTLTAFFSIFALIGVGLILGAVIIFVNGMRFKQSAVSVTGTIVDIITEYDDDGDVNHKVYVTYTFEGRTYERVRLNLYTSGMHIGKEITLLCDPQNPSRIRSESGIYIASVILLVMGCVFFCVGFIPLIFIIKKKINHKKLLTDGRVLYATVERIDINRNYWVNGQNPYIIYCTWKDEYTNVLHHFRSENLWTDPSIVFQVGSQINVYVDANDFGKYYVDAQPKLNQKDWNFTV